MMPTSKQSACKCAEAVGQLIADIKDLENTAAAFANFKHIANVAPQDDYETYGWLLQAMEGWAAELKDDCGVSGGYILNRAIVFKNQMQNRDYEEAEKTADEMRQSLMDLIRSSCE